MKREIFTTTQFLAICILIAISALLGLIGGSIDVFSVLLAISFWMLYSNAKNGKELSGFGLGIGTVKAMWIVGWVFAGIFAVVGLMLMFIPSSVVASAVDFSVDITGPESEELLDAILNFFGQHGMIWLGLAFLLVAVLVAVINFLFNRRFCVFTESLRDCMNKPGWFPEEAEPLRKWMLVLGILSCLGIFGYALNDQSSFQNVCRGVAMILGSVWIRNLDDFRLEDIVIENAPSNDNSWYS